VPLGFEATQTSTLGAGGPPGRHRTGRHPECSRVRIMGDLPAGTVTFLFIDLEGSTRLLSTLRNHYATLLEGYRRFLRNAVEEHGGQVVDTQGDALFAAFSRARDGVAAGIGAQRALASHAWPEGVAVRARMGLHTGEPLVAATGYVGIGVHEAARICAAAHGGQIVLSGTTERLVEPDLPEGVRLLDLGDHRLKDVPRTLRLFQVVVAGLPSTFPPPRTLTVLPSNLPLQLTTFTGRQKEIAEVKASLKTARLLTLTGPGGSGKTRLALEAAAQVMDGFPDGVWFVDLAPIGNPDLVPHAVAWAVGIPEEPRRLLLDTLADALRPKAVLLVLDNCEHLLDATVRLTRHLLQAASNLRILATSREALGLAGERVWPVPPMALPGTDHLDSLERLAATDTVRLFLDRAAGVRPDFRLTLENAPAVAAICRHLDGIPLAIELAAARITVLTPEQIAGRLHDRFRLLRTGGRVVEPRHQTLRAAFDWSHELLSPAERVLFRRLAAFAGGFTLEAAEAACGGGPIVEADVLDLLAQLVDRSLVIAEGYGRVVRYRLLETTRQYAAERLAAAGELGAVRKHHRDWCAVLARQAEPELRGSGQEGWVARLVDELDNLRAALDWCRTPDGGPLVGLQIAADVGLFWDARGFLREGREWLETLLPLASPAPAPLRARALNWVAVLAWRQGDHDRVKAAAEEALRIAEETNDQWNKALALHYVGHMAQVQGNFSEAERLLQASVDKFREVGDRWGLGLSLNCLGDLARHEGDYDAARTLLEEALAIHRQIRTTWLIAASHHNLGYVMLHLGEYQRAIDLFRESLAHFQALGNAGGQAMCLAGLASAAAGVGGLRRAATLFGAADALMAAVGESLEPVDRVEYDRNLETVRAGLEPPAFEEAWKVGQAMDLNGALRFAVEATEHK